MSDPSDSPTQSKPVVSMTGSGVANGETEFGDTTIELRSVNGRTLGLKHRLPAAVSGTETTIERAVQARLRRGSVTCIVEVAADPSRRVALDRVALAAWTSELRAAAAELGLAQDLGIRDLIALPGVVAGANGEASRTTRVPGRGFAGLLAKAVDALVEDRARDGAATAAAIREQVARIAAAHAAVTARAPKLLAEYRERLLQRVNEYLVERARPIEQDDVLREVAVYADRVDSNEELQRIAAHLDRVGVLLTEGGEIGRPLEFLMQELLREVNTLGSKTLDVEIAHTVVSMKSCVDKLRELVANLE